jgi:hypothetical protein
VPVLALGGATFRSVLLPTLTLDLGSLLSTCISSSSDSRASSSGVSAGLLITVKKEEKKIIIIKN